MKTQNDSWVKYRCISWHQIIADVQWEMTIYVGFVWCIDVYWSDCRCNQYSTSKIKWNKLSQVNVYRPGLHCKSLIYLRSSDPTRIIWGFLKQNKYQRKVCWNFNHNIEDVRTLNWSCRAIKEQDWLKGSVEMVWGYMGFCLTANRRHELEN